jgi:hypothetical protein
LNSSHHSKHRTENPTATTEKTTAAPVFQPCAPPVPDPDFRVVEGDDVSTPPWFEVGAAVKVPGDPPLRVWTTVAECETEEADLELAAVFRGVDEAVVGIADALPAAVPSPPEAEVAAALDPPLAAPEITPVYEALKAETAARTLDGSGAIVPPLYLLHCEVFKSLRSASEIP